MPFRYRTVGKTGVTVIPYRLGVQMNGSYIGNQKTEDSARVLSQALDGGSNLIDAVHPYDSGEAETLVRTFASTTQASVGQAN